MKAVLQLFSIVVLWNYGAAELIYGIECLKPQIHDLRIPVNSIVEGIEKRNESTWYQHVIWHDNPAGGITLRYRMEYYYGEEWIETTKGKVDLFLNAATQEGDMAYLARRLLGLSNPLNNIPGRIRTPATLFSSGQCVAVHFTPDRNHRYRHRLFLDAQDDDKNKLLYGQLVIFESEWQGTFED